MVKKVVYTVGSSVAFVLFLLSIVSAISYNKQTHVRTGEITNLYVKNEKDSSKFYIVLNNKEVITNTDSILFGKYNSADIQAALSVGEKVTIKTAGHRDNLFSMYENAISVKEVK